MVPGGLSLADFGEIRKLGDGPSGTIKQVVLRKTGEAFALWTPTPDQSSQESFRRELAVQGCVRHPHIVTLLSYFEDRNQTHCVFEYADRGSLAAYMKREGPLLERRGAQLLGEVVAGLEVLHRASIMHGDLRPESVLLFGHAQPYGAGPHAALGGSELSAKLSNLAWAADLKHEKVPTRDTASATLSTLEYFAPEVLLGETYGLPADLWALGVLLHEMLRGRAPFTAESREKITERICAATWELPVYGLSPGPEAILQGLLRREGAERLSCAKVARHPWVQGLGEESLLKAPKVMAAMMRASRPSSLGTNPALAFAMARASAPAASGRAPEAPSSSSSSSGVQRHTVDGSGERQPEEASSLEFTRCMEKMRVEVGSDVRPAAKPEADDSCVIEWGEIALPRAKARAKRRADCMP